MKYQYNSSKTEQSKELELTHKALGMFYIKQVGEVGTKYVLVEIPYNPDTGETGKPVEVLKDNREDVIDRFKIEASKFFEGV